MTKIAPIAAVEAAPKEDLYYAVHKGIRLAHARLLVDLGGTDAGDADALGAILDRVEAHVRLCFGHLDHEEKHIHTALEAAAPGAAHPAEEGHESHLHSFRDLRDSVAALRAATADRGPALRRLYQRFALFVADDLVHMNDEETRVQPALERAFTADQIAAVHQRILADIAPDEMVAFMRVMLPAASEPERRAMVTGMQAAMPADVFDGFMAAVTGAAWMPGDWDGLARALR